MYQINTLYTLNLQDVVSQVYFNFLKSETPHACLAGLSHWLRETGAELLATTVRSYHNFIVPEDMDARVQFIVQDLRWYLYTEPSFALCLSKYFFACIRPKLHLCPQFCNSFTVRWDALWPLWAWFLCNMLMNLTLPDWGLFMAVAGWLSLDKNTPRREEQKSKAISVKWVSE